jgi:hypothetical protein
MFSLSSLQWCGLCCGGCIEDEIRTAEQIRKANFCFPSQDRHNWWSNGHFPFELCKDEGID